jgi:glycosyltransferase involved in cell wall biosynthesis
MHVITGLDVGGAEMMLLRLLSVNKREWEPAVVSLIDEGTIGPRIAALGIPVYSLGMRRGRPNPVRALSLMSITRQFHPQLIQGWMYHGNLMASLAGAASQERAPVIWGVHQSLSDLASMKVLTRAMIHLGAFFSRHPATIIYVSQLSAKQHEALGYHPVRSVVIPNGIDCQVFRPDDNARRLLRAELGIDTDATLVGLVARYHPVKDHASFLRAAAQAVRNYPDLYFLLVGKDVTQEQPALRELIAEHQLQDRTFLLGERFDIPHITAALDIACSASRGEAFSIAVAEAMACGVPCVVTDVGDSAYLVGDTGVTVPPRNPAALTHAIGQLIDAGSAKRRELGMAARKRIESEFSLSAIVRRFEDLYRSHTGTEKTQCVGLPDSGNAEVELKAPSNS